MESHAPTYLSAGLLQLVDPLILIQLYLTSISMTYHTSCDSRRYILARPNPGHDSLTKYLKTEFPWKKNFYCEPLDLTFQYEDVVAALKKIKVTDPALHRIGSYRWASYRSRNDIANGLYMDSSTLKRFWDKFNCLIMNYLLHGDIIGDLDSLDLIQMD